MDMDGNGKLSKEEILRGWKVFSGTNISLAEVDAMFENIDFDGNGQIDYSEFTLATLSR